MKDRRYFLLILMPMLFSGCSPLKNAFVKSGDSLDDAVHIAILDFSKTRKLFRDDSVFSVEVVGLYSNNDIIVVRIAKNNRKLLLTSGLEVGSRGELPSRYLEKDSKLFFWWDDEYALSEGALAMLNKYNLLQDDENGRVKLPDRIIEDELKAAHYYFCKGNFASYKRIITNKGIGYYDPPRLECGRKS